MDYQFNFNYKQIQKYSHKHSNLINPLFLMFKQQTNLNRKYLHSNHSHYLLIEILDLYQLLY